MRGLAADGVTQPSNSAALISVIIDGVSQPLEAPRRGSRGVWDVERLAVLRGAQSIIQGRNAFAGAVVVKTKDPVFEPDLSLHAVLGEPDRREASLAVLAPLIENVLAFRLTREYLESESDIEVLEPANQRFIEDEYDAFRGKPLYQPKSLEDLRVMLTIARIFDSPSSATVSSGSPR